LLDAAAEETLIGVVLDLPPSVVEPQIGDRYHKDAIKQTYKVRIDEVNTRNERR
jgi:hypothetical protein